MPGAAGWAGAVVIIRERCAATSRHDHHHHKGIQYLVDRRRARVWVLKACVCRRKCKHIPYTVRGYRTNPLHELHESIMGAVGGVYCVDDSPLARTSPEDASAVFVEGGGDCTPVTALEQKVHRPRQQH